MFDVAAGLWGWTRTHPEWQPGDDWEPAVSSFCVTSSGVTLVLDGLAPEDERVWERLDGLRPSAVVYLKPDHIRDLGMFCDRYGAAAYGDWDAHAETFPDVAPLRADGPGLGAARGRAPAGRRPLAAGDAGVSPRAAGAHLRRRRHVRSGGDAAGLGHAVARAPGRPHAARAPRRARRRARARVAWGARSHGRDDLIAALDRDPWRG